MTGMFTHKCEVCEFTEDKVGMKARPCTRCGGETFLDFAGANVCAGNGDYDFTSQSMAINPCQTTEHQQLFPDIEVRPDGCLRFDSVKKREKYMDTCGFHKPQSKIANPRR